MHIPYRLPPAAKSRQINSTRDQIGAQLASTRIEVVQKGWGGDRKP